MNVAYTKSCAIYELCSGAGHATIIRLANTTTRQRQASVKSKKWKISDPVSKWGLPRRKWRFYINQEFVGPKPRCRDSCRECPALVLRHCNVTCIPIILHLGKYVYWIVSFGLEIHRHSQKILIKLYWKCHELVYILSVYMYRETHSTMQGHHRVHREQTAGPLHSGNILQSKF